MINLIIFGSGDLFLEILSYLKDIEKNSKEKFNICLVVSSHVSVISKKQAKKIWGKKIKFSKKLLKLNKGVKYKAIIAIADADKREKIRKNLYFQLEPYTLIHPLASVSDHSKIGKGTIIAPHVIISPFAKIGCNVFINAKSIIGHHAALSISCSISTACVISGHVKIGKTSNIGSSSFLLNHIKVAQRSSIVSSSSLFNSFKKKNIVIAGNPAKIIAKNFYK
jgi:acetyltransferase EpsM